MGKLGPPPFFTCKDPPPPSLLITTRVWESRCRKRNSLTDGPKKYSHQHWAVMSCAIIYLKHSVVQGKRRVSPVVIYECLSEWGKGREEPERKKRGKKEKGAYLPWKIERQHDFKSPGKSVLFLFCFPTAFLMPFLGGENKFGRLLSREGRERMGLQVF